MKAEGIDKATAQKQVSEDFGYKPPYKKAERTMANPFGFDTIYDTDLVPDAPFKKNWH